MHSPEFRPIPEYYQNRSTSYDQSSTANVVAAERETYTYVVR